MCFALASVWAEEPEGLDTLDIEAAPHRYSSSPTQDPFSRLRAEVESGRLHLESHNEKEFLVQLLTQLKVPISSQLWVFSTTSLQLSRISPSNPRALYFNEENYVGYVPGGRIEVISMDPRLGGIFYIFDIPHETPNWRIERSDRCMNCHAGSDTDFVPGLLLKSVIPGRAGGSLTAYRSNDTGHGVPLAERFGGWHVTGENGFTNHAGNCIGQLSPQGLKRFPVLPGERFQMETYPVSTSDLLPHLVLEHQAGFVNRLTELVYWTRTVQHLEGDKWTSSHSAELERKVSSFLRYVLFADEAPLPAGGIRGDSAFRQAFLGSRRASPDGSSLKDLQLRDHLFHYRCSYMIYSSGFREAPAKLKRVFYENLGRVLKSPSAQDGFGYLPPEERKAIYGILRSTLDDLPPGW